MEFVETAWKGFRNLQSRRQQWRPGLNVILGSNGSGKTNLLESFNVLTGWGVFPTASSRTSSLIAWDDGSGTFLFGQAVGEKNVEVQARIGARMSLQADKERVTHSELRLLLPSLCFLPQDIGLLDGSPSVRRLFLDKLCALSSPTYARRLAEYKQLVRQRTALLRQNRRDATFRATAVPLAQLGGWIRGVRQKIVHLLAKTLSRKNEAEAGNALLPFHVEVALDLRGTAGLEDPVQDMAAALEASLGWERQRRTVLAGPHRDDLLFSCLGRPAHTLSRGQKRRLVVAAILASGFLIETALRVKPLLLLDDVTAELDAEGKELMGHALARTGWQVFATGVEDPFGNVPKTLWRIREGGIE